MLAICHSYLSPMSHSSWNLIKIWIRFQDFLKHSVLWKTCSSGHNFIWYAINARAWWAHQWFDTLLYWKLIIQKYFSIFKIDKKVFQLKNKLTDMRAFFSYFTWSKKKVMQHYFWNWLTHNFCHTLERWGRYYRMGSFKIFAEAVRNFWNQNVINASLFHVQHN